LQQAINQIFDIPNHFFLTLLQGLDKLMFLSLNGVIGRQNNIARFYKIPLHDERLHNEFHLHVIQFNHLAEHGVLLLTITLLWLIVIPSDLPSHCEQRLVVGLRIQDKAPKVISKINVEVKHRPGTESRFFGLTTTAVVVIARLLLELPMLLMLVIAVVVVTTHDYLPCGY
jgi:hypothetical protein